VTRQVALAVAPYLEEDAATLLVHRDATKWWISDTRGVSRGNDPCRQSQPVDCPAGADHAFASSNSQSLIDGNILTDRGRVPRVSGEELLAGVAVPERRTAPTGQ